MQASVEGVEQRAHDHPRGLHDESRVRERGGDLVRCLRRCSEGCSARHEPDGSPRRPYLGMAVEIERKFLLREDPTERLRRHEGERLRQGYLAIDQAVEVRVRIGADSASVTIKAGRGLARTEVDLPVAASDAEELWTHTVGRRIEKTRYRIDVRDDGDDREGPVAEVDIYHGELAGLRVVEVEFASELMAAEFAPPDWFGREVSGDERWSNAHLARHGAPEEFTDELP